MQKSAQISSSHFPKRKEYKMEIGYAYWQEPDGFYLGYLNFWPEHWTQGKNIQELEEMLLDLYEIYLEEEQEKNTVLGA
jgi:predicted RNase H-like HicB family nuclease